MAGLNRAYSKRFGVTTYGGAWNASTNIPAIQSGVGRRGLFYIVSVAGNTVINGIGEWEQGDWIIFNGTAWEKLDTEEKLASVNGQNAGNVRLTTSDVPEGSRLYFTDARAKGASVTDSADGNQVDMALSVRSVKAMISAPAAELHVVQGSSAAGPDGSSLKPFSSVQSAHNYAVSNKTQDLDVVIMVHPGSYAESVTITRPRTHIKGLVNSLSNATKIVGNVTINPSAVVGGLHNNTFTLENLLITPASGNALTFAGDKEANLFLTNLYCFAGSGGGKMFSITNTAAVRNRVSMTDCLFNNISSNATSVEVKNVYLTGSKITIFSGNAAAIDVDQAIVTLQNSSLECAGNSVANLGPTASFNLGVSTLTNTLTNKDGATLAAGTQYSSLQNLYNIAGTGGFAIKGVAGSVLLHSNNGFMPGSTNRVSSAMSPTSIPVTTTLSFA